MKKNWKKLLAGALATAMVMGMLSVGTLAAEEELELTSAETIEQVEEKQEARETGEAGTDLPQDADEVEEVEETPTESEEPQEESVLAQEPEAEECEHDWVYESCAKLYSTMCWTIHNDNVVCSKCGAATVKSTGIGGHSHNFVVTRDAVDTGITNDRHTVECTNCTAIETRGHVFAPATCVTKEVCECGYVKRGSDVDPDNHVNIVVDKDVAATCTTTGLTEGSHCDDCGEVLVAQEETPLAAHTVVTDKAVDATCTEAGLTEGSHCSVCDEVLEAQEIVKAQGHKWNKGVVTKEPTVEEDGEKTFTCTVCEATKTESIAKLEPKVVAKIVRNEEDVTFTTLQVAVNAATEGETVILLVDVTENVTATNKTITLDLGGNTVDGGNKGSVLTINGGDVTLTGNGTITGGTGYNGKQGGGLYIKGNATVTMENGTITGNHVNEQGGGVFIDEGTFTMKDGTISENTAKFTGGGVFVYNFVETKSALFVMEGGTISGNTANGGAGVGAYGWKQHDENLHVVAQLNGGVIENNTAQNGGGVVMECGDTPDYIPAQYGATGMNTMEINGVTIRNNHANLGGGVWSCDSILKIDGATITGNHADKGDKNYGGGVYVQGGEATLTNVDITGNAANYGGGLYAGHKTNDTIVTMTSGKLYGNTVTIHSADIYCNAKTTLILPDASKMGGELNGHSITDWFWDNTGAYDWGGSYVWTRGAGKTTANQCLIAAYDPRTWYTVTYTDGVENAEIFADQVVRVVDGAATPAFEGTPSRTGYTFTGWNPAVAETVTVDVTYTAQWTRTSGGGSTGGGDDNDDRPVRPTPTPTPTETPEETPDIVETLPEEDVPLAETPVELETLTDEEVPLAETPDMEEGFENLGELEVPLAEVPKTGDSTGLWMVMAICSLLGLVYLGRKKEA